MNNMKEYKIGKGWAILMYICSPLFIVLFSWLLVLPFLPGVYDENSFLFFYILVPLSIGMIVLLILGLIYTVKGKFVIDTDRIYILNIFNKRSLLFSEIKGFRIGDKAIIIESAVKDKKHITISTYYGESDEILDWLHTHYDDLDVVNIIAEEKNILTDHEFGRNAQEREHRLQQARRSTNLLNSIAIGVSAWGGVGRYHILL